MLNKGLRFGFYMLLIIALVILVGMFYWEHLYQTSSSTGRNELREGWSYIFIYGWPVFLALAGFSIWKRKQLAKSEMVMAVIPLAALALFFVLVTWT
jgi:hypothetical protein